MNLPKEPATPNPSLEVFSSRQFLDWLATEQISLAATTYQTSRLLLIGVSPEGRLSGFERLFDRAMGLYATTERLYLSTKYQLWQFDKGASRFCRKRKEPLPLPPPRSGEGERILPLPASGRGLGG